MGPGAGLDRYGKSRPTGIRSPGLQPVASSYTKLRYPGSLQPYMLLNKTLLHGVI